MSLKDILKTFEDEVSLEITPELEFLEKDSGGISLKGVLQRYRAKHLREKSSIRQGQTFSPSTVTYNYCRRLKVAQLAGKTEIYYDKAAPAQQTVFDMGNVLHAMVQNYFWEVGLLKGSYKCHKCDRLYHDLVSPTKCPAGKKAHDRRFLEYREIKVKNSPYKLSGRIDGIAVIEKEDHLFDIKSIAARTLKMNEHHFCFEDLDRNGPKIEHLVQINLYMFMSGIHRGHLLYICKNDGKIKTFAVPYDEELLRPYLNEIRHLLSLAEKYKSGKLLANELPTVCGRKTCNCETFLTIS